MVWWSLGFFILTLIAAAAAFTPWPEVMPAQAAKVVFYVTLTLFLVTLLLGIL